MTIIILRNSDMYFYLSLAQNNHRLEANTKRVKRQKQLYLQMLKKNYICKTKHILKSNKKYDTN